MIKNVNGVMWYCCPECGKRLFVVSRGAECHGIITKCKKCGWIGEIKIQKGA